MRFSITLILLSCMSLVMAQSNNSDSKLEEGERKRLENQFKALKNFYINEQGLVVYQTQGDDAKLIKEADENTNTTDTLTILVDDFTDYPVYSTSTDEESVNSGIQSGKEEDTVSEGHTSNSVFGNSSSNVVSINKRPMNPVFVSKEQIEAKPEKTETSEMFYSETKPDEAPVTTNRIIAIPSVTKTVAEPEPASLSEVVENKSVAVNDTSEEVDDEEQDAGEAEVVPSPSSRKSKSIFEKEPSRYENMEAAAWATQDLLDKLKSAQSGTSSSGSLSSRLSKGAGNSSLKKNQSSLSETQGRQNRPIISKKTIEAERKYEEANTSYDVEAVPTYYINGVEVDKSIVDKLKKTDILNKETRTRNTQSGNPAGEIWIQLK